MDVVSGDSVPCGLVEVDATGRVVDANGVLLAWLGVELSEIVGRSFSSIARPPESTGVANEEYLAGLFEVEHSDGSRLPVFVVEGTSRAGGHRLLTVVDASTQRAFRERLQSRHGLIERTQKRLELVIAASITFAETTSEAQLANVLATTTAEAYAAEESVVFLLDADLQFHQVAGTNPFAGVAEADVWTRRGRDLHTVVKISGVEGARAISPAIGAAFEATGVQAMIIAPMHQGDQQLGILAAFFHHPRQFDEQASPLAEALAGQAARAVAALRLQNRLEHAATHDETTGLPNRRLLEEKIDESRRTTGTVLAVLFVDLDGFKNVNDQLGHQVGDEVLREVAARLREAIRDGDVVARYGGDEFVVVGEVASESAAMDMAERVREVLGAPYEVLPAELKIGASIGVSVTPAASSIVEIDELVRAADRAMYTAKYAGGDQVVSANTVPV